MIATKKKTLSVQYLTRIAVLTALSSILFMISIPIVAFYSLDLSNLPVLLGAFSMGPVAGLIILGLKSLIGCLTSSTMYVGELADFIMGAAFVLPAALIYQRNKSRKGALIGMITGTVALILAGCLTNAYLLIPFYMKAFGMPMEAIIGMCAQALPFVDTELKVILFVTAPFNLLKGVVLCILTYMIYKPLSPLLHVRK
ncbi:MAG TPA: ECF transporter S component [Candidatus Egerieenecus merdigallinarum]|nr:ECF transporter S component [Candidatus Egerieenecus merdigallinarum]